MSLVFNDTTTRKGIVQEYERECGLDIGRISDSTDALKEFTAGVNLAFDDFTELAIKSSGTWQWDDSNWTDYPIITTNLVANQRDYSFTVDESGSLILEIYKVLVADSGGYFTEIKPRDVQSEEDTKGFTDGRNTTGIPSIYDKTANGIFLDPIPSYNYTNGLKVYINREPSYFVYNDTTKKPGVPGIFHRYFALKPALDHARRNTLSTLPRLEVEVFKMEENIKAYFARRNQDERKRLVPGFADNK